MDLLPTPGAGFDAPFEMLSACHERVQRTLRLMQRLHDHLREHGADEQARSAARDVMRYFELAAPAHHEDEERHVFPALLAADAAAHGPLVARLQDDHRQMAARWPAAREGLAAVAAGCWTSTEATAWGRFAALYADHIVAEESIAFPAAKATCDDPALAAMGAEMAQRRGLTGVNTPR